MAQKKDNIFTNGLLSVVGLPFSWAGKSFEKMNNFLFDSDGIIPVGRGIMYAGAGAGGIVGAQWGFVLGAAVAAATGPVGAMAAGIAGAAFGLIGGGVAGGLLGVGATVLVTAPLAIAGGFGAGAVVGAARSIVKALTPSTWFGKRIREKADEPAVIKPKQKAAPASPVTTQPKAKLNDAKTAAEFNAESGKKPEAANDDTHKQERKKAPKPPKPAA